MYSESSLPPSWERCSSLCPPNISYSTKSDIASSSNMRGIGPGSSSQEDHELPLDSSQFSVEISQMHVTSPKDLRHRRTHSDILALLNDISFDGDLGVLGGLDVLSVSNETKEDLQPEYLVLDKFNLTSESSVSPMKELSSSSYVAPALSKKPRGRLQHSQSLLVVNSFETEMLKPGSESPSLDEPKTPISAAKLADLALADPKRAKRIWANKQSAARSKERKMRYIGELQSKVQTMQTEKFSLSMQYNLLQRDITGVVSENIELKLQLQSIEQQVQLQDALNDALKKEIQHLKILTGQAAPDGQAPPHIPPAYGGANQQYHTNNNAAQPLSHHQFRQHQLDQFHPRQLLLH